MPGGRIPIGVAATAAVTAVSAVAAYLLYARRRASGSKQASLDKRILRSAYSPSPYTIEHVSLNFILNEEETIVESTLKIACNTEKAGVPLHLDGEELTLRSISLDGKSLREAEDYVLGADEGLTLLNPPARTFELKTVVAIKPQENTQLSGLYKSSGNYCTQCEAIGL